MSHNLKIIIWNVGGLNAHARHLAIRSVLDTTGASIVCFQETKMELICSSIVLYALGADFDDYVYLPLQMARVTASFSRGRAGSYY